MTTPPIAARECRFVEEIEDWMMATVNVKLLIGNGSGSLRSKRSVVRIYSGVPEFDRQVTHNQHIG